MEERARKAGKRGGRRLCPACGSEAAVRIVYGYPSTEGREAAERGEIALGGCCVTGHDPQWRCPECGHEWPDPEEDGPCPC
jgi:hypothetical protein